MPNIIRFAVVKRTDWLEAEGSARGTRTLSFPDRFPSYFFPVQASFTDGFSCSASGFGDRNVQVEAELF
jgi:hypothetical protein